MTQPQQHQKQPQQAYSPLQKQLYHAIIENRPQQIPGLIAQGADPNMVYNDNRRYLQLALSMGNTDVFEALVEGGADINAPEGSDKVTPAYFAAGTGNDRALEILVARGADITSKCGEERPTSPLNIAVTNGRTACVKILAENGADLTETDEDGNNLLHDAAVVGEVASILILARQGVDMNAQNRNGDTPAHVAGTFIKTDAAWMFKALGADLTIRNKSGRSAEDGLAEPPYHPLVLEKLSEAHANKIKHMRTANRRKHPTP